MADLMKWCGEARAGGRFTGDGDAANVYSISEDSFPIRLNDVAGCRLLSKERDGAERRRSGGRFSRAESAVQ